MIPRIQGTDEVDISCARWVFIIEKEVCVSCLQHKAMARILADCDPDCRQSSTDSFEAAIPHEQLWVMES